MDPNWMDIDDEDVIDVDVIAASAADAEATQEIAATATGDKPIDRTAILRAIKATKEIPVAKND